MKKLSFIMYGAVMLSLFCSCGDTSKVDNLIESAETNSSIEATIAQNENYVQSLTDAESSDIGFSANNGEYDVDLTILDGTMVYAQVYDMMNNPEKYNGKMIRASGPFDYYQDPQTGNEYFAVLISDAAACCAQGIEFVLDDEYSYPDDYPEVGTEITISGCCDIYKEGSSTYCQLLDAEISSN